MPELPEVETVRKTLNNHILGKTIDTVDVYWENIMPEVGKNDLKGETIKRIDRKGKFLIFILTNQVIVGHMRMEGRFFIKDKDEPRLKHEHVKISFTDGTSLRYIDTRKFGRLLIRNLDNYLEVPPLSNVAPEPHQIDFNEFYKTLQRKSIPIKQTLLDQSIVAGLGNIYVDETLFRAKILPTRPTNSITKKEAKEILKQADIVLKKATELGGTTIYTYESQEGVHGRFQNELLVHTKVGKPCPVCNNTIEKIKVGGRGTYVCFKCQK